MAYAQGVMQKFLSAGVDTWLHCSLNGRPGEKANDIKPEHLVSVITNSHADSLIVLGDRNMKNNTCQGRRQGKLHEVPVDEHIRTMLLSWSQELAMGNVGGAPVNGMSGNGEPISERDIFQALRQFGKAGNVDDRVRRLEDMLTDLEGWSRRTQGPIHRGSDQSMVAKLTKTQTSLIKLHKEVVAMDANVRRATVVPDGQGPHEAGGATAYSHIVSFMGLGRGVEVNGTYRPLPPESPPREAAAANLPSISEGFRERAVKRLGAVVHDVETCGARVSAIARGGNGQQKNRRKGGGGQQAPEQRGSLWDHYFNDYKRRSAADAAAPGGPQAPSASAKKTMEDLTADLRQLVDQGIVTFQEALLMLDPAAAGGGGAGAGRAGDDWKMSGAAGKKKKKQQKRELEQKQRREREANARRLAEQEARRQRQQRQEEAKRQAKARAQQEAMQQAAQEQQRALQQQMQIMQQQLQQQIQLQQAAAKQIQMQIERQQHEEAAKQQQNGLEGGADDPQPGLNDPQQGLNDGSALRQHGMPGAFPQSGSNVNETFLVAGGYGGLLGGQKGVGNGIGDAVIANLSFGQGGDGGGAEINGVPLRRNRTFDPDVDGPNNVANLVDQMSFNPQGFGGMMPQGSQGGGFVNHFNTQTLRSAPGVDAGASKAGGVFSANANLNTAGLGGVQFSSMAPSFEPTEPNAPAAWAMMARGGNDNSGGVNAPNFNVGASEFVPGDFGTGGFYTGGNDAPAAPESPPHSSLMKPSGASGDANQRWNQYGQW
jgi:hypothetical protein